MNYPYPSGITPACRPVGVGAPVRRAPPGTRPAVTDDPGGPITRFVSTGAGSGSGRRTEVGNSGLPCSACADPAQGGAVGPRWDADGVSPTSGRPREPGGRATAPGDRGTLGRPSTGRCAVPPTRGPEPVAPDAVPDPPSRVAVPGLRHVRLRGLRTTELGYVQAPRGRMALAGCASRPSPHAHRFGPVAPLGYHRGARTVRRCARRESTSPDRSPSVRRGIGLPPAPHVTDEYTAR